MVRDLGEQVPRVGPSIPICGRILDNSENNLYVRITVLNYTVGQGDWSFIFLTYLS